MGRIFRLSLAITMSLVLLTAAYGSVTAADKPIRSSEVVEVIKSGIWSWIGVKDAEGKIFWVMASNCTVGVGGKFELLAGEHFDKLKVESLGREFTDCYAGEKLRINGQLLEAYGAHGLPNGCIDLGGPG
jgi:hypothetical protein